MTALAGIALALSFIFLVSTLESFLEVFYQADYSAYMDALSREYEANWEIYK